MPGGTNRMLDEIADLNNDGISDLVVKRIKADGIFGWESEYEVYLGEVNTLNRLAFTESPSSVIQADGFQFDINGRTCLEMAIRSLWSPLWTSV